MREQLFSAGELLRMEQLASEALDWQPSVTLAAGLKPTIAYFDALLKRSPC